MTNFSRLFMVVLAGGLIGGCACPMHKESKAIDNEGPEVKVPIEQVPAVGAGDARERIAGRDDEGCRQGNLRWEDGL